MKTSLSLALALSISVINTSTHAASLGTAPKPTSKSNTEVVLVSEVKWEKLNPARGDKSPQAGTLWGNRMGSTPTGFLAKFVDGFSSPPHIHPITYRAVVISGGIHNDDPDAAKMWMSPGSFWTQPKGEVHITAAKGNHNIALVEIDKAPYLVRSFKEAFDSKERPVNIDASNIVWTDLPSMPSSTKGPKIAYLWGKLQEGESNGTFIKLPAGFNGKITSHGSTFRAVVIKGQPQYLGTAVKTLDPGSYFGSTGEATHPISSSKDNESIIYIRTNGKYKITS